MGLKKDRKLGEGGCGENFGVVWIIQNALNVDSGQISWVSISPITKETSLYSKYGSSQKTTTG